ncbi:MBL fold metallo-hydrolase [Goodfellowiella coeruleoviolacea]|uniref:Glyoxylase, beta-lactamase superfamily II n=1 Tax=Goodfellowiella coeruleoviolacea TaxID=334858 RepID=A0AAE3G8E1_9PSEU|nr:MBL fold metallo-hydrolase [Goodfellowiella coeruleoviolacea]MCP2163562.1 Glyoxylase, beta-lactamase superfamily II [Goodfellowiella coeruleoviolacea]
MDTITFGDVSVTRVIETVRPIMPPTDFVPDSTQQDWADHASWLVPDFWLPESNQVRSALQVWVLRSEGRTILVDTGVGNHKNRPQMPIFHQLDTDFLDNLAGAGVRPEDVDLVINTHVHADHVGWNTRLDGGDWVPTFPNATYLLPARDFAFFGPDNVHRSRNPETHRNIFADSVTPVHQAGLVELWDESHVIDRNLRLDLAAGHTPGSSVLRLESGSDRVVFVGDLVHTPIQLVEPDMNSCFCEDAAQARASRRAVLGWAADNNALVVPAHLGGSGAAELRRNGDRFALKEWAPFARV